MTRRKTQTQTQPLSPPMGDRHALEFKNGYVWVKELGDNRYETPHGEVVVIDYHTFPYLFARFEESNLPAPYAFGYTDAFSYEFFKWVGE